MSKTFIPGSLFQKATYNEIVIVYASCLSPRLIYEVIICDFYNKSIEITPVPDFYVTSNNVLIAERLHTD